MPEGTGKPTNGRAIEGDAFIVSTDSGGTFVDAVILDGTGKITIGKAPTTPEDPAKGIVAAVGAAAARAGCFERLGIGYQRRGGGRLLALNSRATHGVRRLRGEAEMAEYRDADVDQPLDRRRNGRATFDLHGANLAFGHQARRIA